MSGVQDIPGEGAKRAQEEIDGESPPPYLVWYSRAKRYLDGRPGYAIQSALKRS